MQKRLLLFVLALFVPMGLGAGLAHAQIALPHPSDINTVAGNGTVGYLGDGGVATSAEFSYLVGVAVDGSGSLYFVDFYNLRIRKVTASTGVISTVAGNGIRGYSGDGVPATSAELDSPSGVAVDIAGNIYIADELNNRIRKVTASTGVISTVAGNGSVGTSGDGGDYSGDGGPATDAALNGPAGVALDKAGNIYFIDYYNDRIRKVTASSGIISTVAGSGTSGYSGDGGPATSAALDGPFAVAVDGAGNIYLADELNNRIRMVSASTGIISTVAGNGTIGYPSDGDGGPATSAALNIPAAVAVDGAGNIYIADAQTNLIRMVTASTGVITTVAGDGTSGYSGDGGLAVNAALNGPRSVAVDQLGYLYIADTGNNRVRAVCLTIPTSTVVSSNHPSAYEGVDVTFTAHVTAATGTPTGTVLFYSDSNPIGNASLSGGYASVSSSSLAIGIHTIEAEYAGNRPYLTSIGLASQTITMVPTGITLTMSPNPSTVTNPVTMQIQVTAANGATMSGAVSVVADGSNTLGNSTLNGSGAASLSTSGLGVGSHSITVSYPGNAEYDSSSVTQTQTVNQIATSTVVTASVATSSYSQCVTYQATVSGSQGTPTETVAFTANASSLGSATLNGSGVASVSSCSLTAASYTITAAYGGATNFKASSGTTEETVIRATPALTWAAPAPITYGTALSGMQLNAAATGVTGSGLPGTFVYTPAVGAILNGGAQTLSVTFTPTDTTDYNNATATVTLQVNKATPAITWATPAPITYGTVLSGTQLDASATGVTGSGLAGTFLYTPAAGTVLTGGAQTLSVTFTPTDTTDYSNASGTVTLEVNRANAQLAWAKPAPVIYGTKLTGAQLDATASGVTGAVLPGTFVYTPPSGSLLGVGSQTLSVTFTPTDTTDYNGASATVLLTVNKETPTVSVSVSPEPSYPGDYATITATVNGVAANYPTGSVTFTIDGSIGGTVFLSSGAGNLSYSFPSVGSHSITVAYSGDGSYNSATGSGTHSVIKIPTTSTISATPNPAIGSQQAITLQTITIYPDLSLGTVTKRQQPTGTVQFFDNGSPLGTASIAATELTQLTVPSMTVGTHVLTASYSGDANYTGSPASGFNETLVAPFSALVVSGNEDTTAKQSVTYSAAVMNPLNQPQQTGTVTWTANGTVLGTSQVANGSTSLTATFPTPGVYAMVVAYAGNQQPGTAAVAQTVLSNGTDGSAPFTISGPSSTTMSGDGSTQATLTFASAGDGSPVALTCTGAPTGYTCNLSPSTLTLIAGATPPSVKVSVTYNQPVPVVQNATGSEVVFAGLGLGLLSLFGLRRKWRVAGLLVLILGTTSVGMSGCGAMSYATYAPQSYAVTVTGTVGKYQESFPIKVGR